MTRTWTTLLLLALVALLAVDAGAQRAAKPGPQLAHMVFFALKDHSEEARAKFVRSCQDNLAGIPGTTYFSVGVVAEDVKEPSSVMDFDVALHVVFESKEAKEAYLVHPDHKKFVEENRAMFAGVRVFDSYLAAER